MRSSDLKCPECKSFGKFKRHHMLEIICDNYSGTGEDVGSCPECGKAWWIHYEPKIACRAEEWDNPSRVEQEEFERLEKLEEERNYQIRIANELKDLKVKFPSEETIDKLIKRLQEDTIDE